MIYCFSNDFDTILIQCYDFGASLANGSKTSLLLHKDCSFVNPMVPSELHACLCYNSTILDLNKRQKWFSFPLDFQSFPYFSSVMI